VMPYLYEMHLGYAAADLVISRAGATTIAELIEARKPSILIPFPHATGRHHEYNARYLAESGTAVCISEEELLAGKSQALVNMLTAFVIDPGKAAGMKEFFKNLPVVDSSGFIAKEIV